MKTIIKYLLIFGLAGIGVALYLYHKPHKDIRRAPADFKTSAAALFEEYSDNESAANAKYLDKIIEVSGVIKEINNSEDGELSITLESESEMFGVICQMDPFTQHDLSGLTEGHEVVLKGICTGMLMDVVLVRCVR